jgi:all-trans-retinol 13,14-reductase
MVYLGLDVDLAAEGHDNTNYFVWGGYDIEGVYDRLERGEVSDDGCVFVTAASLKDPANRHIAPEGNTNLQLMCVAPTDYGVWGVERTPTEGGRHHRDPEYRRRKAELAERLIATAERAVPEIRGHIDWKEAATPVTHERFTRSTGGTGYGVAVTCDQIGPLRMPYQAEIPGLYFCGASTQSGPGIAGVLRGGAVVAGAVLETDLLRLVRAGEVLGDRDRLPELRDDWDPWRESH